MIERRNSNFCRRQQFPIEPKDTFHTTKKAPSFPRKQPLTVWILGDVNHPRTAPHGGLTLRVENQESINLPDFSPDENEDGWLRGGSLGFLENGHLTQKQRGKH
jgi:hypothetical protein